MAYPRLQRDVVLRASSGCGVHLAGNGPVRVLQIGEGRFLRGFFDWMIHACRKQGLFDGSIAVTQPRPGGAEVLRALQAQDGLYTLVVRGLEDGTPVERSEVIAVFSTILNPFEQWAEFLALAEDPHLQFVVSNTTEAGLVYEPVPVPETACPASFPARLTWFLYRRFRHFQGAADKGLICLPCELVEGNGDRLREYVVRHSADWGLPDAFVCWLKQHNRFLNSLVDRIVTACPSAEAEAWRRRLGYEDDFLTVAEPYYLWVIQGDEAVERVLPFRAAGLNVHVVADLTPYQLRKVRILNGAHTLMAPVGILSGLTHVREVMADAELAAHVRSAIDDEVIPTLPLDQAETKQYAATVWERFANPFLEHRLLDIAMNSISKFRVRVLPSLRAYVERKGALPPRIVRSFAALIRLYKVRRAEDGAAGYAGITWRGTPYVLRDDPEVLARFHQAWCAFERREIALRDMVRSLLAQPELWGEDLGGVEGLVDALCRELQDMEHQQDLSIPISLR
ncbi:tagaturonate reductase [Alicyclobacillus cellulosilyticus]|uniref:tagaturonate reductase n=1 Tax=Alicyclobacillus cellulosilyticus TaxID=1003997 RepID=UPI00166ADAF6|nr:tagaturonate reductase [Alicyclobacillus cellulosilyticus]